MYYFFFVSDGGYRPTHEFPSACPTTRVTGYMKRTYVVSRDPAVLYVPVAEALDRGPDIRRYISTTLHVVYGGSSVTA